MKEWAASDRSASEPLMTPTTPFAVVKPADAAIEESATLCLMSDIIRLRCDLAIGVARVNPAQPTSVVVAGYAFRQHGNANESHVRLGAAAEPSKFDFHSSFSPFPANSAAQCRHEWSA